jgi:hypothetical protein
MSRLRLETTLSASFSNHRTSDVLAVIGFLLWYWCIPSLRTEAPQAATTRGVG